MNEQKIDQLIKQFVKIDQLKAKDFMNECIIVLVFIIIFQLKGQFHPFRQRKSPCHMLKTIKLNTKQNQYYFRCKKCQRILFDQIKAQDVTYYDDKQIGRLRKYSDRSKYPRVDRKTQIFQYFIIDPTPQYLSTLKINKQSISFHHCHPFFKMYTFEIQCSNCHKTIGKYIQSVNFNTINLQNKYLIDINQLSALRQRKQIIKMIKLSFRQQICSALRRNQNKRREERQNQINKQRKYQKVFQKTGYQIKELYQHVQKKVFKIFRDRHQDNRAIQKQIQNDNYRKSCQHSKVSKNSKASRNAKGSKNPQLTKGSRTSKNRGKQNAIKKNIIPLNLNLKLNVSSKESLKFSQFSKNKYLKSFASFNPVQLFKKQKFQLISQFIKISQIFLSEQVDSQQQLSQPERQNRSAQNQSNTNKNTTIPIQQPRAPTYSRHSSKNHFTLQNVGNEFYWKHILSQKQKRSSSPNNQNRNFNSNNSHQVSSPSYDCMGHNNSSNSFHNNNSNNSTVSNKMSLKKQKYQWQKNTAPCSQQIYSNSSSLPLSYYNNNRMKANSNKYKFKSIVNGGNKLKKRQMKQINQEVFQPSLEFSLFSDLGKVGRKGIKGKNQIKSKPKSKPAKKHIERNKSKDTRKNKKTESIQPHLPSQRRHHQETYDIQQQLNSILMYKQSVFLPQQTKSLSQSLYSTQSRLIQNYLHQNYYKYRTGIIYDFSSEKNILSQKSNQLNIQINNQSDNQKYNHHVNQQHRNELNHRSVYDPKHQGDCPEQIQILRRAQKYHDDDNILLQTAEFGEIRYLKKLDDHDNLDEQEGIFSRRFEKQLQIKELEYQKSVNMRQNLQIKDGNHHNFRKNQKYESFYIGKLKEQQLKYYLRREKQYIMEYCQGEIVQHEEVKILLQKIFRQLALIKIMYRKRLNQEIKVSYKMRKFNKKIYKHIKRFNGLRK